MSDYETFLATKSRTVEPSGFEPPELSTDLFPFQRDLVRWALRAGRAALFADTGLGKTRMQLEWARRVIEHVPGESVLILAPLAVAAQTQREGRSIGIDVTLCRELADLRPGVNITNYDRVERFANEIFAGVVLDESSIIKHHDAKTLATMLRIFEDTPLKLCATATPAPNDHAELGTHAEFLGVCSRQEMLSEFFIHDHSDTTAAWRLKGHAERAFWRWVSSWAALVRHPRDLGYEMPGYDLPELKVEHVYVGGEPLAEGEHFGLMERRRARKASISERVEWCSDLVNGDPGEPWIVWGELNAETEALAKAIPGAVEVRGSDKPEDKERKLIDFAEGRTRVLVSKPSICGFGLNWQHASRMAFVGVNDSWESYYQAVRRCWRFGQQRPVEVAIFASEAERSIVENLARKAAQAKEMADELSERTKDAVREAVRAPRRYNPYEPTVALEVPAWLRSVA